MKTKIINENFVADLCRQNDDKYGAIVCYKNGKQELIKSLSFTINGVRYELSNPNLPKEILTLPANVGNVCNAENLISRCNELISQKVGIDSDSIKIISMYILGTYLYDEYKYINYLNFVAPPGSGKSVALDVLSSLSFNAIYYSGLASMPSIFRTIHSISGTLILDEVQRDTTNPNDDFHKLLALGNSYKGSVQRVEKGQKDKLETKSYKVFSPKIMGGVSSPGGEAILSRSLIIQMKALPLHETQKFNLSKQEEIKWQNKALNLRNDLLLFRQLRKLGLNKPPSNKYINQCIALNFSSRDLQVIEWLLSECPNQSTLDSLLVAISNNRKSLAEIRGDELTGIMLSHLHLLSLKLVKKVHLMNLSSSIESELGYRISNKKIASELRSNGFKIERDSKGRYIYLVKEKIIQRFNLLGLEVPKYSDISDTSSTRRSDND